MRWGLFANRAQVFAPRTSVYDIVRRLRQDAEGPPIHIDYYRQDCADALAEIERLREALRLRGEP